MSSLAIVCVGHQKAALEGLTEQIKHQLKDSYEIEGAENGEKALEIVEDFHARGTEVALIIADQMMPNMTGDELLIRLHEKYPKMLKIMLSEQVNAQAIVNAVNSANLYRYIAKPWDNTDLTLTVKEALESYVQNQQLVMQNEELQKLNAALKREIAERNQDLYQTVEHLKATQNELIQSEKMAVLGRLMAGVAHEVNTPLGAIRSSVENIVDFLATTLKQLPEFFQRLSTKYRQDFFNLLEKSLEERAIFTSKEKRKLRRTLMQKLDAYEIADADIVSDTLVDIGIYDNIEPLLPLLKDSRSHDILDIAYQFASLQKSAKTIKTATDRAVKIVFAIKTYARHDSAGEKIEANIIEGIETVLILYQNLLKRGVEVIRNYQEVPSLFCYPDELNQVWTNLVHNAVQAMQGQGTLEIGVAEYEDQVVVKVIDSGCGIPLEIQDKIFNPFFTTKSEEEGSGLGLDIVCKIIEKHNGTIEVESVPGRTTFTVSLPRVGHEEA